MKDEFSNRLTSFLVTLNFANAPERKTVWENQVPMMFGTKLGTLPALVKVTRPKSFCV